MDSQYTASQSTLNPAWLNGNASDGEDFLLMGPISPLSIDAGMHLMSGNNSLMLASPTMIDQQFLAQQQSPLMQLHSAPIYMHQQQQHYIMEQQQQQHEQMYLQSPLHQQQKRRRLTTDETSLLVRVYKQNPRPNQQLRDALALRLNMSTRNIQIWFQNRRAKSKKGGKSVDEVKPQSPDVASDAPVVYTKMPQLAPAPIRPRPSTSFMPVYYQPHPAQVAQSVPASPLTQAVMQPTHVPASIGKEEQSELMHDLFGASFNMQPVSSQSSAHADDDMVEQEQVPPPPAMTIDTKMLGHGLNKMSMASPRSAHFRKTPYSIAGEEELAHKQPGRMAR